MCDTARDECMLLTGSEEEADRQSEAHTVHMSGQVGCDQEGWSLSAHQGLDDALSIISFICVPSFNYCSVVGTIRHPNKLERVQAQNYALHIILREPPRTRRRLYVSHWECPPCNGHIVSGW